MRKKIKFSEKILQTEAINVKKFIILLFCVFISAPVAVCASPLFDEVLSDKLSEYGIFENGQGIVYADKK